MDLKNSFFKKRDFTNIMEELESIALSIDAPMSNCFFEHNDYIKEAREKNVDLAKILGCYNAFNLKGNLKEQMEECEKRISICESLLKPLLDKIHSLDFYLKLFLCDCYSRIILMRHYNSLQVPNFIIKYICDNIRKNAGKKFMEDYPLFSRNKINYDPTDVFKDTIDKVVIIEEEALKEIHEKTMNNQEIEVMKFLTSSAENQLAQRFGYHGSLFDYVKDNFDDLVEILL